MPRHAKVCSRVQSSGPSAKSSSPSLLGELSTERRLDVFALARCRLRASPTTPGRSSSRNWTSSVRSFVVEHERADRDPLDGLEPVAERTEPPLCALPTAPRRSPARLTAGRRAGCRRAALRLHAEGWLARRRCPGRPPCRRRQSSSRPQLARDFAGSLSSEAARSRPGGGHRRPAWSAPRRWSRPSPYLDDGTCYCSTGCEQTRRDAPPWSRRQKSLRGFA